MSFISNLIENLEKFESVLKPQLVRLGISSSAALVLMCLCEGKEITDIVKEKYLIELFEVGFAEVKNEKIEVTNKGLIVAKSLSITLSKNEL